MLFKKRKEAKEKTVRELNDRHLGLEKRFSDRLEKAGQIADPAEKLVELKRISANISDQVENENKAASRQTDKKANTVLLAGLATAVIASTFVASIPVLGAVLAIPVFIAGFATSGTMAIMLKSFLTKKQKAASVSHFRRLEDIRACASKMTDEVITNNVKAISQSPLYGQVLAFPDIADQFRTAATAEYTAADKHPVMAAPKEPSALKPR